MHPSPQPARPSLSVRDFVLEHALRRGQRALPVVEDGRLIGIVSMTDAKHLDQEAWATTPVSVVMTRMPLKTLTPEADLTAALNLMVEDGIHQVPIVSNGMLVGMLGRGDVLRYMKLGSELRPWGSAATSPRPVTVPSQS